MRLQHERPVPGRPDLLRDTRMVGVGTATPDTSYGQQEILDAFGISDEKVRSIFLNSAIDRRGLVLPPREADGSFRIETQGELLRKHTERGLNMGREAIAACLKDAGATLEDVEYLCCITTTGLLTPGFSALLIEQLGIDRHCSRLDVVGMGCNAGLNGLTAVGSWANSHPGRLALMVCIEVCSAAYVIDGTMRTSVVNSLFGDGAAAVCVRTGDGGETGPEVLRFSSCIITDALQAMRYDWDDAQGKFSFFLDPEVPYVVGANAEIALGRLLEGTGVGRNDISHWIVHSGGKKVIDSVRANLTLSRHDVRHTIGVLRDHGNVSSGSFLFSLERLRAERCTQPGDYGVLMTMGPGSTIEMALIRW